MGSTYLKDLPVSQYAIYELQTRIWSNKTFNNLTFDKVYLEWQKRNPDLMGKKKNNLKWSMIDA